MLKKNIGKLSLALALIAAIWLILGMFNVVPLVFKLPNEIAVEFVDAPSREELVIVSKIDVKN